jgi:hypothetical protein
MAMSPAIPFFYCLICYSAFTRLMELVFGRINLSFARKSTGTRAKKLFGLQLTIKSAQEIFHAPSYS